MSQVAERPGAQASRRNRSRWRRKFGAYMHRAATGWRRKYYRSGWGHGAVSLLPERLQRRLGLDDPAAVGTTRIEIGCGARPQPGYLHVDINPFAQHVELVAPAWSLPLPRDWATEILAVHSLEHVAPRLLLPTLREWRRVLVPGGRLQVHVPNTVELVREFAQVPTTRKWALMGGVLGMNCAPETCRPDDLTVRSDHQILFDADLLRSVLDEAGFVAVNNLTGQTSDVHTESWRDVVRHYSLIFEASKPDGSDGATGVAR